MIRFILGGASAGKTRFAINSALKYPEKRIYIATGIPIDNEMERKIEKHKRERGDNFITWEEPYNISSLLKRVTSDIKVVVLDCLTIWSGNVLLKDKDPLKEAKKFLDLFQKLHMDIPFFVVSNEVGMGIIPDNRLSRQYREILGEINILFSQAADEVYFMVAGIPWRIK